MPKVLCKCGNIINCSEIPNSNELLVISDVEYNKYSGTIDAEYLYRNMKTILVCNNCNRMLYYQNGFDGEPTFYLREDA